jgi:hypothetical protein
MPNNKIPQNFLGRLLFFIPFAVLFFETTLHIISPWQFFSVKSFSSLSGTMPPTRSNRHDDAWLQETYLDLTEDTCEPGDAPAARDRWVWGITAQVTPCIGQAPGDGFSKGHLMSRVCPEGAPLIVNRHHERGVTIMCGQQRVNVQTQKHP